MGVSLQEVSRRFGRVVAVDGVSLDVAPGEIVCLFGPSGCGKTTLLRLVAGLEPPDGGRIAVDGRVLSGDGPPVPPEKRPVGFVFQDYVLFPHLTAAENVAFGLSRLSGGERRRTAREALASVGLAGLESRYPHELSGGQQQRVALARAFVRRPRAMLLDEPFASIDAVLRRRLREELRVMLKENGAATLLVTHDPAEALALGDRIALMHEGRIVEAADPETLFARPQTLAAAGLFSGAQQIEGTCEGGVLRTAFGDAAAPGAPDGQAVAVIMPGGVAVAPDPAGPARAVDSRFAGPGWIVELEAGQARLRAPSDRRAEAGAPYSIRFSPELVRVFSAVDGQAEGR